MDRANLIARLLDEGTEINGLATRLQELIAAFGNLYDIYNAMYETQEKEYRRIMAMAPAETTSIQWPDGSGVKKLIGSDKWEAFYPNGKSIRDDNGNWIRIHKEDAINALNAAGFGPASHGKIMQPSGDDAIYFRIIQVVCKWHRIAFSISSPGVDGREYELAVITHDGTTIRQTSYSLEICAQKVFGELKIKLRV